MSNEVMIEIVAVLHEKCVEIIQNQALEEHLEEKAIENKSCITVNQML